MTVHVWPWLRRPGRLLLPDWLAITLGDHIFAWRPLDLVEMAHEMKHVDQWREHGWRFPWRYWRASRAAKAAGLDPYWDNYFEVEARSPARSS